VTRMCRWRIEPFKRIHLRENWFANFTRRQDSSDAVNHRIEVAVVGDTKPHTVFRTSGDHLVTLGNVHRHWLLTKNMLTGLRGGDRLRGVKMDRSGDVNCVDFFIGNQLFPVRVPATGAEFFCELLGLVESGATY